MNQRGGTTPPGDPLPTTPEYRRDLRILTSALLGTCFLEGAIMAESAPPPGLAARGAAYWQQVTGVYLLSDAESAVLLETCRTLDRLDLLDAAIAERGPMVAGSTGQPVVNPALAEARQQAATLHRLIAALKLPEPDEGRVESLTSIKARKAAQARWARKKAI